MADNFRVLVLFSGRGSNFENLARHQGAYQVVGALCDNPLAEGINVAQRAGISVACVPRSDYPTRALQKQEILRLAIGAKPDLICLAGFMQIVAPEFLSAFSDRILNIHPSLLPKFPGLDTHARALAAGESMHGCTVHVVDAGLDTGAPIAQAEVPVAPGTSAELLATQVLQQEHRLYPWVVSQIACGQIKIRLGKVQATAQARSEAESYGFVYRGESL